AAALEAIAGVDDPRHGFWNARHATVRRPPISWGTSASEPFRNAVRVRSRSPGRGTSQWSQLAQKACACPSGRVIQIMSGPAWAVTLASFESVLTKGNPYMAV